MQEPERCEGKSQVAGDVLWQRCNVPESSGGWLPLMGKICSEADHAIPISLKTCCWFNLLPFWCWRFGTDMEVVDARRCGASPCGALLIWREWAIELGGKLSALLEKTVRVPCVTWTGGTGTTFEDGEPTSTEERGNRFWDGGKLAGGRPLLEGEPITGLGAKCCCCSTWTNCCPVLDCAPGKVTRWIRNREKKNNT